MVNASDIKVSSATIGTKLLLTAVTPQYEYDTNKNKTDKIVGYKYQVVCPEMRYEKINIAIPGTQQLDNPTAENSGMPVTFKDLTLSVYVVNGNLGLTGKASAVVKLQPTSK